MFMNIYFEIHNYTTQIDEYFVTYDATSLKEVPFQGLLKSTRVWIQDGKNVFFCKNIRIPQDPITIEVDLVEFFLVQLKSNIYE